MNPMLMRVRCIYRQNIDHKYENWEDKIVVCYYGRNIPK